MFLRKNKKYIFNIYMSGYSDLNDVTNDLIIKYDQKFNNTYNKIQNISSSIMSKEELIVKEDDDMKSKDTTIMALEILVVFIFLFAGLLLAYGMKTFTLSNFIYYTIGLIILYTIVTYYYVYTYIYGVSFSDKLKALEIQMKNYENNSLEEDYTCPTSCPAVSTPPPTSTTITGYETPTLRTDSQLDVWQYGELPPDLYTSTKNPGKKFYNNPKGIPNYENNNGEKPLVGTTYPTSTYYQCKWLGGNTNNGGLPNIEKNKYSSIPCDFRPNYEEVGRYVCLKDPNKLNKAQFNKNCDDVSNKIYAFQESDL